MLHPVVVNLKNSPMLRGYYRMEDPALEANSVPVDLPERMTIELGEDGSLVSFDLADAKAVFFVKSFAGMPEQQHVRFFDELTIHPYLWVRMTFEDGEVMEGRVSNTIELLTQNAFRLFPVDELANNRCLFVPKSSLSSFQIIGLLEEHAQQLEVA